MKLIKTKNRELVDLVIVLTCAVIFSIFTISTNFVDKLFSFFDAYTKVPTAESLFKVVFLSLTGLLWLTYYKWRETAREQVGLANIIGGISPDVLTVVNPDRDIIMCNASVKRMFGYEVDEVINQKTDILYADRRSNSKRQHEILDILEKERFHVGLAMGKKKNGETIPLEIITGNVSGHRGAVLLLRDITERKQAEQALRQRTHDLSKRVKELNCLYSISHLVEKQDISSEEIFEEVVDLIPPAWQYPEITCARIILEGQIFRTNNFEETIWKQAHDIIVHGKRIGSLEVCYLEERPESDEGPFLKEERSLIKAIAERLGRIIESKRAEELLRESEERFRSISASAQDGIIMMDNEGNISYWNDSAERIFGYTKEEAIGKEMHIFLEPERYHEAYRKGFSRFKETGQGPVVGKTLELSAIRKDGIEFPIELSVSSVKVQGKWHSIGIVRDTTDRKQAEEVLRKAHDELEIRVEERTAELAKANKALAAEIAERKRAEEGLRKAKEVAEVASQAKSDFLASMSHELRTPLNVIIGFSEILQKQHFGELNEKQTEYVKHVLESGKYLLSLINDILDLSKVEAGKMELELSQVDIKGLLERGLIMINEKAFKHGIRLDLHIPPELADLGVTADERKLKQIMFNLLSNAVKFTPDGGAIAVEARQQGEKLIISVSDTGIGIAPEDQERIFQEFYQIRNGVRDKIPGTGLGLSLTKRLVEMHGDKIWVESEGEEKGSRFSFVLPVKLEHLEEGISEVEKDRLGIKIISKTTLLNHLDRIIGLSKRHNSQFTLCRLHADIAHLKEKALDISDALEKEKRGHDFLAMDKDGYIYLIFQGIDRQKAKVAGDRFKKKLESVLEGLTVSYSMATFPEDGETQEALMRKVTISIR